VEQKTKNRLALIGGWAFLLGNFWIIFLMVESNWVAAWLCVLFLIQCLMNIQIGRINLGTRMLASILRHLLVTRNDPEGMRERREAIRLLSRFKPDGPFN
jgi:hypothetical protein